MAAESYFCEKCNRDIDNANNFIGIYGDGDVFQDFFTPVIKRNFLKINT